MGITERREREREEVRRKILDAARDLFAREGYDRVTMRAHRRGHRVLPHHDLQPLRGQGRPRPGAVPRGLRAPARPCSTAAAPPADPVERDPPARARATRAFGISQPEPLPVHVHDARQVRARRTRSATPGQQVVRRLLRARSTSAIDARPLPRRATWTPSPRCCGRASTARSRCSSPTSREQCPSAPAGARPRRAGRATNALRGFLEAPDAALSMVSLARKNLLHDRLRFVITVVGRRLRGDAGARAGRPLHGPAGQGDGDHRARRPPTSG